MCPDHDWFDLGVELASRVSSEIPGFSYFLWIRLWINMRNLLFIRGALQMHSEWWFPWAGASWLWIWEWWHVWLHWTKNGWGRFEPYVLSDSCKFWRCQAFDRTEREEMLRCGGIVELLQRVKRWKGPEPWKAFRGLFVQVHGWFSSWSCQVIWMKRFWAEPGDGWGSGYSIVRHIDSTSGELVLWQRNKR